MKAFGIVREFLGFQSFNGKEEHPIFGLVGQGLPEANPFTVWRPADRGGDRIRHAGRAQLSFRTAESRHNIETRFGTRHAVEGDLRTVRRPSGADPFRGMVRQAEKSLTAYGLDVQIEALSS